jgi:ABC-type transporter MlaC component
MKTVFLIMCVCLTAFSASAASFDQTNIDDTISNAEDAFGSVSDADYTTWMNALLILGIIGAASFVWSMLQ